MSVHRTKVSSFDTVDTEWVIGYMNDYATEIYYKVLQNKERLMGKNRASLKAIAADLETVVKRLEALDV